MFRSYAQNLEDVLLARALKDVLNGHFIDIGAGHPVHSSVTKGFTEAGWNGINVEPLMARYLELCADRPRDINLRAVVLLEPGTGVLFESERELGVYSTTNESVKQSLQSQGFQLRPTQVPAVTLAQVIESAPFDEVHFLKVDVEGSELAVLSSYDFNGIRPWIIVAEVVAGVIESHDESAIDTLLDSRGYKRVFFDGLNVYYVAAEHGELALAFSYPAGIRDGYVRPDAESAYERLVGEVAEVLGCESTLEAEVMVRLRTLIADRFAEAERSAREIEQLRAELNASLTTGNELHATIDALERDRFARERRVTYLASQLESAQIEAADLRANAGAALAAAHEAKSEAEALRSSTSWRVTRGMRFVRRRLRRSR